MSCLISRLLVVSEHPTHSRMFTFSTHMSSCLLLCFLARTGLREALLRLHTVSPQKDNAKRLHVVLRWLRKTETPQYLRRAVLCMRLTDMLHNMLLVSRRRRLGTPMSTGTRFMTGSGST